MTLNLFVLLAHTLTLMCHEQVAKIERKSKILMEKFFNGEKKKKF
jgi:hypothetical protein